MQRETINQILELRFANKTYEEISATVGYTPRTVGRVLGKHRADLALMHSQWLELNNEKLQNDIRSQSTHRATILHQLREELSTRKFSDIPTDKLMRMIEQGERAERETENRLTKIIHCGNQSIDDYVAEIDEPSSSRALPSMNHKPSLTTLPKPIPLPVPAPAHTAVQAATPTPQNEPESKAERMEPEDYIPEDWTAEEEAIYQQDLLEDEKRLAQELKTTTQLKNPDPSSNEAKPQKKAA
ncbi:MAG: hypothetical protein JWN25_825 [Verrucomicrobiales bacterium]|nr:hypothetical protein [Verrucomicrobiales bacterium]